MESVDKCAFALSTKPNENWRHGQSVTAGLKGQTGVLKNTLIIPVIKRQMIRHDITFLSK